LNLGVTDHEIARLKAQGELDRGEDIISMENGMAVFPQRVHDEIDDPGVFVGDDDAPVGESIVRGGPHYVDLGPGRDAREWQA
jgi:hypothetical protein